MDERICEMLNAYVEHVEPGNWSRVGNWFFVVNPRDDAIEAYSLDNVKKWCFEYCGMFERLSNDRHACAVAAATAPNFVFVDCAC